MKQRALSVPPLVRVDADALPNEVEETLVWFASEFDVDASLVAPAPYDGREAGDFPHELLELRRARYLPYGELDATDVKRLDLRSGNSSAL